MKEIRQTQEYQGASFFDCNLNGVTFDKVSMVGATVHRSDLRNVQVTDCNITGLTINGMDVEILIEAELERLHPELAQIKPGDTVEEFRGALAAFERMRAETLDQARELPDAIFFAEPASGGWSISHMLRHLAYDEDRWVRKAILHSPNFPNPVGLPGPDDATANLGLIPANRHVPLPAIEAALDNVHESTTDFFAELTEDRLLSLVWEDGQELMVADVLRGLFRRQWEYQQKITALAADLAAPAEPVAEEVVTPAEEGSPSGYTFEDAQNSDGATLFMGGQDV